jgi:hypothetical protein
MVSELESRLDGRKKELQSMCHVVNATPVVLGGALIIPIGLLQHLRKGTNNAPTFAADAATRSHIEQLAMNAVRRAEEAKGCKVVDVSKDKCGWDLTSYPPVVSGKQADTRHIEVKGRAKEADTVTVTYNEIFHSWNQGDKYYLAIVLVGEGDSVEGPHYIQHPFKEEPGWGVSSINFDLKALLDRAQKA